ncbi:MAG TPA: transketolase, partial [Alphaproteobacteria bacterium]|nr:transketolase [Alphaproteobacteria bacterium]
DRPVCFIAYTIKGFGLPFAGHKDNHAGLMTKAQMAEWQGAMRIRPDHEWDRFEGLTLSEDELNRFLREVPFAREGRRRLGTPKIETPQRLSFRSSPEMSTQQGFGLIMDELGKAQTDFAARIVTTSPDVTVSTNLGPWVNRRGLFARESLADTFKQERIPSTYNWTFSPGGQHVELGIAEMNL